MDNTEQREFHKERQWTSFKAQVLTALSTATFFGVLMKLVGTAFEAAGSGATALQAAEMFADPMVLGFTAVALAAGTAFTYMAQHQWTDLRIMEDDHLAKRNAECQAVQVAQSKAHEVACEHEQNQRSDGKTWVAASTIKQAQPQLVAQR